MDYWIDLHTHTIASGHGSTHTITDLAKEAANRNIPLLGITDHGPATMGSASSSYFRSLGMLPKHRFGVSLLFGVELNILDTKGKIDLEDSILSSLDYSLISLHPANFPPKTKKENTQAYIHAFSHPKVKIIGHPDDCSYEIDYEALISAAKKAGVFLELNEASLSPQGYRGDTRKNNLLICELCKKYSHPILLSSDSHGAFDIGNMTYAKKFLQEISFPQELILNTQPERLIRAIYGIQQPVLSTQ